MFSPATKRRMGVITVHPVLRQAAALARAFILLEDPALSSPHGVADVGSHPHRVPLRSQLGTRRPGAGVPRAQTCIVPVASRARRGPRDRVA
jgi:hypothetical protein